MERRTKVLDEIQRISQQTHEILFITNTVFPFDLFPDKIAVDRAQITLTRREFFFVGQVTSIRIEDVLNATAQVGPFFGSLRLATRFFENNESLTIIKFLWRSDALKLKAIINGLIIVTQNKIDIEALGKKELVERLIQLDNTTPTQVP